MNFTEGKYVQDRSREVKALRKGIKYYALWGFIMRNARFKESKHFNIGQLFLDSYQDLIERTRTNNNKAQFDSGIINRAFRFFKEEGWIEIEHKNKQILIFVIDYKQTQSYRNSSQIKKIKDSVTKTLQRQSQDIWKNGGIIVEPSI